MRHNPKYTYERLAEMFYFDTWPQPAQVLALAMLNSMRTVGQLSLTINTFRTVGLCDDRFEPFAQSMALWLEAHFRRPVVLEIRPKEEQRFVLSFLDPA